MERYLVVEAGKEDRPFTMQTNDDTLAQIVQTALAMADDLKRWGVAAALDKALIELTGTGMPMPCQLGAENSVTLGIC
jgi:hypothetical protein